MRLTYVFVLVALGAAGCNSDGSNVLAGDANWRLRCPVPANGCLVDREPHAVSAKEGDSDADVACSFLDVGTNQRALSFEFVAPGGASLSVDNVLVNDVGGIVEAEGCQVRLEENGVFFGPHRCGPLAPTVDQPCQLTTLVTDDAGSLVIDSEGTAETISGPTFTTTLRCLGIRDEGAAELRDLDSAAASDMPVPISFVNCDGL